MFYFYVLHSEKDDQYYGSTSDLKRRYRQHYEGKVMSTKDRRPLDIIYYEAYGSLDLARRREKQVKTSNSIRTSLLHRIK